MSQITYRYVNNFSLKLISACLVFFYVFFVSSLSLAVNPDLETTFTPPAIVPVTENVLWDQLDNPFGLAVSSQAYTDGGGIFDMYDARAADDFLVPDEVYWSIQTIRVFGTYRNPPVSLQSIDIVFFTNKKDPSDDNNALPGEPVHMCVYKGVLPEDEGDPNFVISLPDPCILKPGRYWVSIQANMPFLPTDHQWSWGKRTVQTLSPFAFENPGNGYGTGCIVFSHGASDCGLISPDLNFQLVGEELLPPVVPTLETLGLAILSVALGFVWVIYYRKTKKQQTPRG